MKIVIFMNGLGLGGTEKAAVCWARGLKQRGHLIFAVTLQDGPRRKELEECNIECLLTPDDPLFLENLLRKLSPDVIHAHAPGYPHEGDVLGRALAKLDRKPAVIQTNIFGKLQNPSEKNWVDYRLFVSWTSCAQAALRAGSAISSEFFRRKSVAVYPVLPATLPAPSEIQAFRKRHGLTSDEVLLAKFARPDPTKWDKLTIEAFLRAASRSSRIRLLLQQVPESLEQSLKGGPHADRFVFLPATPDRQELFLTQATADICLHTSAIGESFGYGIAEMMRLGKPVITNAVPWADQAQLELVRHGECGFICGTTHSLCDAILRLSENSQLADAMAKRGREHILQLADLETSTDAVETAIDCARRTVDNPNAEQDCQRTRKTLAEIRPYWYGSTGRDHLMLRAKALRIAFGRARRSAASGMTKLIASSLALDKMLC